MNKPGPEANLDILDSLHPDIVFSFLETGQSAAISKELQLFILQIQWASQIWETERNTARAARKLKERILINQNVRVSIITCRRRIYEAMEYFDVDHNVAQEIWDRNAADKFEDLMKLAIAQDKLTDAGRFLEKANELRRRANSALNAEDLQMPDFLISTKMDAETLGFPNKNMQEISKKATDGYYIKLINGLPIDKKEKERLLADADIEDIEFDEIESGKNE